VHGGDGLPGSRNRKRKGEGANPIPIRSCKAYEPLYRQSLEDAEGFWAERADELGWYQKWNQVLDSSNAPFYKWFVGGKTNSVHNALDRHIQTYRKNKLALVWVGEPGDVRKFSYYALNRNVSKFANVLKSLGVRKGDIVTIYLPRVPEQVIAMLACAKIGAVHSVVYGGFSVEALAERIEDAQSRVLITADGGWLRGKIVTLKDIADEAIASHRDRQRAMSHHGHLVADGDRGLYDYALAHHPTQTGVSDESLFWHRHRGGE
jgi:hypothetical protein